jgi:GNAT superfamily N-acetyltransferase
MISIRRFQVNDLIELVSSPDYQNWEVIPISRHRAISYTHNPRCSPSDIVLYLAYINNRMVGYRTVLPDTLLSDGKAIRVGWLSGNWVDPTYRRKGIATELLRAAMDDWNSKLLFTNYAAESKAVYDKAGSFENVFNLTGTRVYIRPCIARLASTRIVTSKRIRPILAAADLLISLLNPLPFLARFVRCENITYQYLTYPDVEVINLFEKEEKHLSSARLKEELQWVCSYPWMVSAPLGDRIGERYFFSSSPKHFERLFVKVYEGDKLLGFIMINNKDGFITTPYIACPEGKELVFAKILIKHVAKMGCSRLTTYHPVISQRLKGLMPFGLLALRQQRKYYVSKIVTNEMKKPITFVEGDGDCAFV